MEFADFASKIQSQFDQIARENKIFVTDTDQDEIWRQYLAAFPPGSDPIFRKRTEHDCSCCRHFIRAVGNVVSIQNGVVSTIWDATGLPPAYQAVADAMAEYVRSRPIRDVFLTSVKFEKVGQPHSRVQMEDGTFVKWSHFAVMIPTRHLCSDPETVKGDARTTREVLRRGLRELTSDSIATVLDLIDSNSLYRGAEHRQAVAAYQKLQRTVDSDDENRVWENYDAPAARIRNTAIGTLLQDLSEGVDLERAVKSFETKVAPQNYKRPTALITPRMIEVAMGTIRELDLEPALDRRHARLSDVSVNSVLWVDRGVKGRLKEGIADRLLEEVKPTPIDVAKAKPIGVEEFLSLPHKGGMRLYLTNDLLPHFVSVTAPANADSKSLFKWGNDFAWSYEGNVTDSIKEKVKRAGGQVEGVALRCSLAWDNTDDLDLHCHGPYGHVYYGDKRGFLDVDMNVGGETREPVENMRWQEPANGLYTFSVNNFTRRESVDVGFTVEVETSLGVHTFRYDKSVHHKETIQVCNVTMKNGQAIQVAPAKGVTCGQRSQEVWGLKTLDQIRVNAVILSPNYWDGEGVGNKHHIFLLEGCKNPNPCRGIYNEYLHPRLDKHRKVFEVLGEKTKCPVVDEQLSGVGFSSTRKDKVVIVSGGTTYAVQF